MTVRLPPLAADTVLGCNGGFGGLPPEPTLFCMDGCGDKAASARVTALVGVLTSLGPPNTASPSTARRSGLGNLAAYASAVRWPCLSTDHRVQGTGRLDWSQLGGQHLSNAGADLHTCW